MSFQNQLWEGTAAIYERYSEQKALGKDVVAILQQRVAAEERYARELAVIGAKLVALTDTESSLPAAWLELRAAHAARSEAHSGLAKKLQSEIVKVLLDDIRDRSTKKGELFEEDKALHAKLEKHKSTTEGALQRFLTASAAAEASRKQFHFAQQDASIPPKKLKVLETQEAKLSSDADKAHEAYKQALQELNAFQKEYETSLGKLLTTLQEMDETRSALMANLLRSYMDGHINLAKSMTQMNEAGSAIVAKVNAPADLQKWIQSHDTQLAPEPLVEYEGYEPQFENASAEEVPKKVGKVFPKSSIRKGSGTASPAPTDASGGKKLQRQKSLSRLLGNKKTVKKNDPPAPGPGSASPVRKNSSAESNKGGGPVISGPVKTTTTSPVAAKAPASVSAPVKQSQQGRRARALFEFIASDDTEISFAVGDIITVVREDDSGWWDCDKDGELGLAPGNYLEFLSDAPAPAKEKTKSVEPEPAPVVKVEAKAPEPVEDPEHSGGGGDDEDAEPIGWVTALYDFAGDGDDELPVKTGDRVEVYAEVEGWYTGVKDGVYGLIPKNFCSPLAAK